MTDTLTLKGGKLNIDGIVYSSSFVYETSSQFKKLEGCGEPPLLLGVSVHEALQEAVMAARKDSGKNEYYQLPCPATVDKIRMACGDAISLQCDKQSKASEEKILY